MEESTTKLVEPQADKPDGLSVRRWLVAYIAWLFALAVPAAILLSQTEVNWREFLRHPIAVTGTITAESDAALKLLLFAIYISLACTFLPLPTGAIVSAVALQQFAPSQNLWITTLLVASVGAVASTVANLHDFHLFTLVLRHKSIGRLRETKFYSRAAKWFGRRPFALLVIFNILPIPIDVIRLLAASYRYPLRPFAAANFIGRWVRYAVIASVTFVMGDHGWLVAAALLGVAIILGCVKIGGKLFAGRSV